jgi:hypothetical protein
MEAGPERRSAVRYPFTAAADVVELRSQARVAGRSSDLGLGGCLHRCSFAVCRRFSRARSLGARTIKTQHQAVLRAWVAELSGEPLPEHDAAAVESDSGMPSTVLHLQQVLNELINTYGSQESHQCSGRCCSTASNIPLMR